MSTISKITLGTVQLGLNYGIANSSGKPSDDECFRILDTAYEGGINTFDTAMSYGDSERIIGDWIKSRNVTVNIITKLPKFESGLDPEIVEKRTRELIDKSFEILNINFILGMMFHSYETFSQYNSVMQSTLSKYVAAKKIGWIGLSVYSPAEIIKQNSMIKAYQAPANLLDQRFLIQSEVTNFFNCDTLLFVRSVFLQGLFFLNPELAEKKVPDTGNRIQMIQSIAKNLDLTVSQLAYMFVKSFKQVNSIVMGAETVAQIRENLQLENHPFLSHKEIMNICQTLICNDDSIINPSNWKRSL